MIRSAGRITTFLAALAGVVLPPFCLADWGGQQKNRFSEIATAAVAEAASFASGSPVALDVSDWVWLENRPEIVERFRGQLPGIVKQRAGLARELDACLRANCPEVDVNRLLGDLVATLELQAVATDRSVQNALQSEADALRLLTVRSLEARSDILPVLEFQLVRVLLASANAAGDVAQRMTSLVILERLNRKYADFSSSKLEFALRIAQLDANIEAFESTAEHGWIDRAVALTRQILLLDTKTLAVDSPTQGAILTARARFVSGLARLEHFYGKGNYGKLGESLLKQATEGYQGNDAGLASAALAGAIRLAKQPLHITIVSPRKDPSGQALFEQALRIRSSHRQLEWWDRAEGGLLNENLHFPLLKRPAAFVCVEKRCSLPVFEPDDLPRTVIEMGH